MVGDGYLTGVRQLLESVADAGGDGEYVSARFDDLQGALEVLGERDSSTISTGSNPSSNLSLR